MNKDYRLIHLPKRLIFDLHRSKIGNSKTRINSIIFCNNLLSDSYFKKSLLGAFVNYSSKDLRRLLGHDYRKILKQLEAKKIIEINEYYFFNKETGEGVTKSYAVHYQYLNDEYESFLIKHKKDIGHKKGVIEDKYTARIIKSSKIDLKKAKSITLQYANDIEKLIHQNRKVKIGEQVDANFFKCISVFNETTRRFKQLTNASRNLIFGKWYNENYTIIQNGKAFYYMSISVFIQMKQLSVIYSYTHSIACMQLGYIFVNRDDTTYRKHHNFTSMPTKLLESCIYYKGLIFKDADLNNSQFCLLSYSLNAVSMTGYIDNKFTRFASSQTGWNTDSTTLFQKWSYEGKLYTEIQKALNLKSRNDAKNTMFEILFGSSIGAASDTESKAALRRLFPELIQLLDDYKAKYGYEEMSKELQRIESTIFVDIIFKKVKAAKLDATTKHDSLIIYPSHYDEVVIIMKEELDRILGKGRYNLK